MAKRTSNSKILDQIEVRAMEKLKALIDKGKQKGALSYKDIMDQLESVEMTEEQIDEVYELFGNLGIDIVDSDTESGIDEGEGVDEEDFEANIRRHLPRRSRAHVSQRDRTGTPPYTRRRSGTS